ncbi:hypothetical protein ABZ566_22925, partial [Streptomyces hygroscopicus]|uniref:hypothetical protein n=1 Tax=Streptomyces hygroscopicus TaxID=1912 RepID=UPI0033DD1069
GQPLVDPGRRERTADQLGGPPHQRRVAGGPPPERPVRWRTPAADRLRSATAGNALMPATAGNALRTATAGKPQTNATPETR